jgi:hypothetical protein
MNEQDIWVIVGFGFDYIQGKIENQKIEDEYRHAIVGSRFVFPPEIELKRLKNLVGGPSNRGYYTSKELAVNELTANFDLVHEMGYYTYILIERVMANTIDQHYWPDGETWFKLSDDFKQYEQCEKPKCFHGIVDFA